MIGFSEEWNAIYKNNQQLTSWPWSDLISLVFRHCRNSISNNGSILELGCGAGPNIPFIKSIGMDYYGLEGSNSVVKKVHYKFPDLSDKVTVGDFTKKRSFLNLPELDIIIDRASVTHNNQAAIIETIKNCQDCLKPGGYYIGIDWFSTQHSDFLLGIKGDDSHTRYEIPRGQFKNVGNVHFSDEEHLRFLFSTFDIISLEEKIINSYEPINNHKFASWNIVVRKKLEK
jgi:SAM-dependent methyltransferase